MVMVLSQFFSVIWDTVESKQHLFYGQNPRLGPYEIGGFNDEPYTDRVIACVQAGDKYEAVQVSDALTWKQTTVTNTTGDSVNGYRLAQRDGLTMNSATLDAYTSTCSLIAATMDELCGFCRRLGYKVSSQDHLRVVNGVNSTAMFLIPKSLSVLVMPFWDDAPYARYAIPGSDGSACMFRLLGRYEDTLKPLALFRGVNRTIREQKTVEWLGGTSSASGVWRNGWLEGPSGDEKWYSDVISTDQNSEFGIPMRQFNAIKNEGLDCVVNNGELCREYPVTDQWGSKFSTTDQAISITSITIANGRRFGFFMFDHPHHRTVKSTYDWETLISNVSIAALLFRWFVSMFALQYGYFRGHTQLYHAGIGCLANSRSFNLLPIVLLPRLKMTLSAFWTVGCEFEGEQKALSEAWFVMYPAILELMLLYFSLLNIAAKILRRRIPDDPFGPTVLFFCLLHWFRLEIAQSKSGWFGIDGRVTPRVVSTEFEKLRLVDFFISDVAFRLNGSITSLFVIKLVALALNLLPLVMACSKRGYTGGNHKQLTNVDAKIPNGIERILAIRAWNVGGLGVSSVYEYQHDSENGSSRRSRKALNSYELVRLGFVVFGSRHLISLEDWEILSMLWPLRSFYRLWNHRVTLFTLQDATDSGLDPRFGSGGSSGPSLGEVKTLSDAIQICRLDDPKLQRIAFWKITGRPVR